MRKMFLFMMVSVDGYFEAPGHDISWHNADAEFSDFVHEQCALIGTIVMGHRTFELMESFWPSSQGQQEDPETARFMTETPKVVATYTPFTTKWGATTVISEDVAGEIGKLKAQEGKDIAIFGSNNLCVSLMDEGLVDEFRIMVNPIALGEGTALFKGISKSVILKRTTTREFKNGNILNTYVPAGTSLSAAT